ncbi:MAG: DUF1998 domain-containing protein, partial [Planctomycetota bacterium]|nr:DUF1998 domain-containing protein [Planctomycetota bacterium]
AIRVLLPIASYSADSRMLSFRAALALGFRKRFAGDPQHLQIRLHDEPAPDGTSRLRFLVIYDSVPGGTGYLSELWHGDNFRSILELALRTLEECSCQRREVPGDGCYECLYAYQDQYSLKQLTSREARDQIRAILARWGDMTSVDTLSGADLGSRLESELEERFVASLRRHAESRGASWSEVIRRGERQWRFTWGGRSWLLVPQELLAEGDGVDIQSRPDFLLKPADGDRAIRPLAVFCDGFRFHASPGEKTGRICDDVIKRRSICESGRWQVFGVTWSDLDEFDSETARPGASSLQLAAAAGKIDQRMGARALRGADAQLPTMLQMLRYLEHPDAADWEMLADSAFLVWLAETKGSAVDAAAWEHRLLSEPLRFDAPPEGEAGTRQTDDDEKARLQSGGAFSALARWRRRKVGDEPAGVRLVLRLFDEWDERRGEGFEAAWRAFLATWNLAQFLPGLVLTTSEELSGGAEGAGTEPAARPTHDAAEPPEDDPVLADATPEERELIAVGRAAGLGDPELGGEPFNDEGVSCGMSVMLWEHARIALVLDEHREDQKKMEDAGWTLCDAEPSAFRSLLARDGADP